MPLSIIKEDDAEMSEVSNCIKEVDTEMSEVSTTIKVDVEMSPISRHCFDTSIIPQNILAQTDKTGISLKITNGINANAGPDGRSFEFGNIGMNLCPQGLMGIDLPSSGAENDSPPELFIKSTRGLGGWGMEFHSSDSGNKKSNDPRNSFVPKELVASLYKLEEFLLRANEVSQEKMRFPIFAEHLQDNINTMKVTLNKHHANLKKTTTMCANLNSQMLSLIRSCDLTERIQNNIACESPCAMTSETNQEFVRKTIAEMKAEYDSFDRNYYPMKNSVHVELTKTFQYLHQSMLALLGRMEAVRMMIQQLKVNSKLIQRK